MDTIIRSARPADAPVLGRLWVTVFDNKFRPILGADLARSQAVAADFQRMSEGFLLCHTLVAEVEGRVAGFLLYRRGDQSPPPHELRATWPVLRRHLGLFRAAWALFCLSLIDLERLARPGQLYVEMLGVDSDHRGQGIGRRLMERAIAPAKDGDQRQVALDVVGENRAARRLYQRLGFRVHRTHHNWLFGRLFGFDTWHRMVLDL